MKKFLFLIMLMPLAFGAMAQRNYMAEANVAFESSQYAKAKELYKLAYVVNGADVTSKTKLAHICDSVQASARLAVRQNKVDDARGAYNLLLTYNPKDAEAAEYVKAQPCTVTITAKRKVKTVTTVTR